MKLTGPAGTAERITAPMLRPDQQATLAAWLIRAPGQSPAWEHYLLGLVHLRPIAGVIPAHKFYPEAEYELMLVALDSSKQPRADDMETLHHLTPLNHRQQFHGVTDEQAVEIARLAARAVVDGFLPAEPLLSTGGGADAAWEACIKKTVEHYAAGRHGA